MGFLVDTQKDQSKRALEKAQMAWQEGRRCFIVRFRSPGDDDLLNATINKILEIGWVLHDTAMLYFPPLTEQNVMFTFLRSGKDAG
jgi:hypothetical protein